MKITVGTNNPGKLAVVRKVFEELLDVPNIEVAWHNAESGVPEAPHDEETYLGALNRAQACAELKTSDYYVGIESGLVKRYGNFFEEAWSVIISKEGVRQIGYSSGLLLPSRVVERMNAGEKHNKIMESIDKELKLPDDNRDTWSRYTGGAISRTVSLEEALRNALIQAAATDNNLYK